jgi:hypothetical protein
MTLVTGVRLYRTPPDADASSRKERMMRRDRQPQRVWCAALAHTITEPVVAVVMGVPGSCKTTVSFFLSATLGCQFQEAMICVVKMYGGTRLTDALAS